MPNVQQYNVYFQVLPASEFVIIPNSAHMIMMEQPDLVNELIRRFITSDGGSSPPLDTSTSVPLPGGKGTHTPHSIMHSTSKHKVHDGHNTLHKSQPSLRAISGTVVKHF